MRRSPEGEIEVDRSVRPVPVMADVCPSLALRLAGREASTAQILAEAFKDEAFFRKSGGGVTFSGGEPLAQAGLLMELASAAGSRGLGTAIETCLAAPWELVQGFVGTLDHWLVDLKHCDSAAFRAGTGGDAGLVLGNIERLALAGADVALRVPVVPGFNDDEASMRGILAFAASLPRPSGASRPRRLDLLPYHDLAMGKYAALGRPYAYAPGARVEPARIEAFAELGRSLGLEISLGG